MAHEDLHRSIMNGGNKIYRRRKKYEGSTWTPEKASALTEDGVWCSSCRMRHGYKSKQLGVAYENRQTIWHILWTCLRSGNVIKDQPLLRK